MSQIRAILSGKEDITANLIRQVAKDNFKLVRPMLEALKMIQTLQLPLAGSCLNS